MQNMLFYALLIGINQYKKKTIRKLKGCVNDVNAVKQVLNNQFAVPDAHIQTLINEEATRDSILNAFREHLIGQAKAWAATETERSNSPPAFLLHYSGHGSQVPEKMRGIEPDGYHETIVPYDSRIDEVYDIKDWELRNLLDELAHYSSNITVVLDCCHSGAGTRLSNPPSRSTAQARHCPTDYRPQPLCTHAHDEAAADQDRTIIRALHDENHVLLAACRNKENAFEDIFEEKMHGTLTHFWVQELSRVTAYQLPTYQEVYRRIRHEITTLRDNQTPQCEGAIHRELFGRAIPKQEPFFDVIEVDGEQVWINGGAIHQLTVGTLFHLYPPNTRTLAEAGPSLGMLQIEDVGVVQSRGSLTVQNKPIPLHAQASVHLLSEDEHFSRPHIVLNIDDAMWQDQIYSLLMERKVGAYIDLIDGAYYADFRLQEVNGQLEIQDGVGKKLTSPYERNALEEVALDLERVVRYHNALALHNPVEDANLKGKVDVAVKKLSFNAQKDPISRDLPTTIEGYAIIETGQKVVLELSNRASKPLYMALLEFNNDWSISSHYPPPGTNEALLPGQPIYHGLSRDPKRQLKVDQLPEGVNQNLITLKLFASTEETDFSVLTQDALHRPAPQDARLSTRLAKTRSLLDELLQQAMHGRQTRFSSNDRTKDPSHEWTTTQMKVLIRRS